MILPKHSEKTTDLGRVRNPFLILGISLRVRELRAFSRTLFLCSRHLVKAFGWYVMSRDENKILNFPVDTSLFFIPHSFATHHTPKCMVSHLSGVGSPKDFMGTPLWLHRLYVGQMQGGGCCLHRL